MAYAEGEYCTDVRHTCKKWLDDQKLPFARCGEYEKTARCVGERVQMGYCIDKHEYTPPGSDVPANFQSFVSASKLCKAQGKRICTEAEWNFACEGEEMRPYPYGWSREPKCNQDRDDLFTSNPMKRELADRRLPSDGDKLSQCVSPFGVYNMVGNLDEPVLREEARFQYPYRNGLKGGWWMAGRNRCRPATTKHDDHYNDIQVGARCCADVPGTAAGAKG
jgi:formylglycine-generating enzyme required for sulfatase activity